MLLTSSHHTLLGYLLVVLSLFFLTTIPILSHPRELAGVHRQAGREDPRRG
jgi:hypothetical protein